MPPLSLTTVLITLSVPCRSESLKVQMVSSPERISRLSMPVPVDVPVAVGVAVWIAQEAESRLQPAGTASFRSRVVVGP